METAKDFDIIFEGGAEFES